MNFILSALIIENVSGLPYREYMRKRVFAPLGMTTADVDSFEEPLPQQVKGYDLRDGTLIEVPKSRDWMLGAGDLVASADDVYALHRAIRDRSLLRPGTWDEVLTPDPINGMGMGCRVFFWHGHPCVMHNGGHTGFRTLHMQLLDGDLDVVFLSNCGFGDARSAVAELVWEAFSAPSASAPLPEMDKGYI